MTNFDTRKKLIILSTALVVVVNVFIVFARINGKTYQEVLDASPIVFLPATYAFIIKGLIYIGLAGFVWYRIFHVTPVLRKLDIAYIISCIANCISIVTWRLGSQDLSAVTKIILLGSLIYIYRSLHIDKPNISNLEKWLVNIPFGIYLSWTVITTISSISKVLYLAGWSVGSVSPESWGAIMIIFGGVIAELVLFHKRDFVYGTVYIWAVIGIMVRFQNINLISTVGIISITLVIIVMISKLKIVNKMLNPLA